jgi:MarR family transcriptional regulator, lower aerobic nicotinate degradation pathway regulator
VDRTTSPAAAGTTSNVGFLLAKASQRFNELLVERFAQRGFPDVRASYGSVLVPLFEHDGLRLGELAAASRLSKQAMTGLVKLCEQDGLVVRERDADDGRAFRVSLSPRGRRVQAVADEVLGELDEQLVRSLGSHNHDALVHALKGVIEL